MENEILKKAISEALTAEYEAEIPPHDNDHAFSQGFEKKMNKLIKRQKKPYYKLFSTASRRAAGIAAAVIVASSASLLSADGSRNGLKDYKIYDYTVFSDIGITVDSDSDAPQTIEEKYEITYDLSDFYVYDEFECDTFWSIEYLLKPEGNKTGQLDFEQFVKPDFKITLNTEGSTASYVEINGYDALYYDENIIGFRSLIWDNGDYIFFDRHKIK